MTSRAAVAKSAATAPHVQTQPGWLARSSLAAAREQGMLFQWSPMVPDRGGGGRRLPLLSYWVCGRLFGGDGYAGRRECYVCYHDSAPQVVVELAFRLAYGMAM